MTRDEVRDVTIHRIRQFPIGERFTCSYLAMVVSVGTDMGRFDVDMELVIDALDELLESGEITGLGFNQPGHSHKIGSPEYWRVK